mmetsp:Transcript_76482/g.68568  ORF Transcript_76482/g.68568 Transcript_76482/m.68568 type:complete len:180 (-) Transcript_76482:10-549(-)
MSLRSNTNIWFVKFVIFCTYLTINEVVGNDANTNNNQFEDDVYVSNNDTMQLNVTSNYYDNENDNIFLMENKSQNNQQSWYIGVIGVICAIVVIFIVVGVIIVHQTQLCADDVSFSYSTHRKSKLSQKNNDTENLNQSSDNLPQIKVITLNDNKPIKPKPIRVQSTSSHHPDSNVINNV